MSDVRAAAERQYPVRYGYGRARYGGMLITDDSKDVWDVLHQCLEDHQMLSQAYLAIEAELAACRDEVERWQQLARAQSQAIQAAKAECERLREEIDDQHPESCLIDQFCSRVCRLGTRGCINTHDEEERQ